MIESQAITLRPWAEHDLACLMAMRNDVALQARLLSVARGSTIEQVRNWLDFRTHGVGNLFFVVADRLTDELFGYLQCSSSLGQPGEIDLGICLRSEAQGHGIGGEALDLALRFLESRGTALKVNLRVRADNHVAIRCYLRCGFTTCGMKLSDVFIDDAWHDVMLLERRLESTVLAGSS